ncbi:MAG TPA: asparagine synthase (glutamine-hydrolyzing) [Candidatus Sulfotelmatobacter sp.]|jgi:asparagine synthase (glutamine-hydrolysing)|nr:asparagine synthase (glutamine-hydrolyzing) [Candidatus Sulfotelmatobacter sp.]
MCGLAGILGLGGRRLDPALIASLTGAIAHRGPDGEGFLGWDGESAPRAGHQAEALGPSRLFLAHRRLAIIDVGDSGWQPMFSEDGAHAVVFNGEIYNYLELRAELVSLGWSFRSESDTEVLLKAWIQWGPAVLPRLIGMFSFALFDQAARKLFVARDPFGIKPFYWTRTGDVLAFASEIKALRQLHGAARKVAAQGVYNYLRLGFTDQGEDTLLDGVKRLPPAHWAEIDLDNPEIVPRRYWSLRVQTLDIGFDEAASHLRDLFVDAVRLHLRSDVPVGAALSGGIDSSAVVMAMRALQGDSLDIHAFSYTAADDRLNEEKWIDLVGAQSGSTVHKIRLSPAELVNDLDAIIAAQDEPFGSTSILAQYHVYKLARRTGIKVTMDGQGADEMLGGYPVFYAARLASLVKAGKLGQALSFLAATGPYGRSTLLKAGRWLLPSGLQAPARRLVGERLDPPWLNAAWFEARGASLAEALPRPGRQVLKAALADSFAQRSLPALLRYGDRNSMAHSVESRVPFLCTPLVEFIFSLPEHLLIDAQGTTKAVFRAAMRGIVPDAVLDRRDKIGFATPQTDWLTAMSPWVERVLESEAAKAVPLLNQTVMRGQWAQAKASGQMPGEMWRWLNLIRWAEQTGVEFV